MGCQGGVSVTDSCVLSRTWCCLDNCHQHELVTNACPSVPATLRAPHVCRTLILIFGATLLPFGYIPNFRKMRVILVVGVAGTL